MVCDMISQKERAKRERARQLAQLEMQLRAKSAKIAKVGNVVSIEGWNERGGWCDACAVRKLRQSADPRIRMMVSQAVPANKKVTFGHGH